MNRSNWLDSAPRWQGGLHRAMPFALAASLGLSTLACHLINRQPKSQERGSHIDSPRVREEYLALLDKKDAAEANAKDAKKVWAYVEALEGMSQYFHNVVDRKEKIEFYAAAVKVLKRLAESSDDHDAAEALLKAAGFEYASGKDMDGPEVQALARQAYQREASWKTATALIETIDADTQQEEGVGLCTDTYDNLREGQNEQAVYQLVRFCGGFSEFDQQEATYPSIPKEYWDQIRADIQAEGEVRYQQRKAEEERRANAPCLYNAKNGQYQKCTSLNSGRCYSWGAYCDD